MRKVSMLLWLRLRGVMLFSKLTHKRLSVCFKGVSFRLKVVFIWAKWLCFVARLRIGLSRVRRVFHKRALHSDMKPRLKCYYYEGLRYQHDIGIGSLLYHFDEHLGMLFRSCFKGDIHHILFLLREMEDMHNEMKDGFRKMDEDFIKYGVTSHQVTDLKGVNAKVNPQSRVMS